MIISKLKNLSKNTQTIYSTPINSSLPLSLNVAEQIGYNRYILKFKNKTLKTKSDTKLSIGADYWGEISGISDNIIIKNILKKPDIGYCPPNAMELIQSLTDRNLKNTNLFLQHIINSLQNSQNSIHFQTYANMLLALNEGVIHISFKNLDEKGLIQIKQIKEYTHIYLIIEPFSILKLIAKDGKIVSGLTHFSSVSSLLSKSFNAPIKLSKDIKPIWKIGSKLVDFKG